MENNQRYLDTFSYHPESKHINFLGSNILGCLAYLYEESGIQKQS